MSHFISSRLARIRPNRAPWLDRKGAVIVLAAFMIVPIMGMLAFSVDIGYIANVQTELKRAADAGALAGAGMLVEGREAAIAAGRRYAALNHVGSRLLADADVDVELGDWDEVAQVFTPKQDAGSAIRVIATRRDQPLFFGKVFGRDRFSTQTESIATYRPRDIMIVLDYSGSMNDDSELTSIGRAELGGRAGVEANLLDIYNELGSPTFGSLRFAPEYVTLHGQPASGAIPHVSVTFRSNDVYVTSTKDLSNVVLEFQGGSRQKFEGLTGRTGTFKGTGSNASKRIDKVWVKSGTNFSSDGPGYGERFQDDNATLKSHFGLAAYPYPGGSWDDYINYVKNQTSIKNAGYRKKYGYLTWVNYLLEVREAYAETPDLWRTSEQPITALKESVKVFFAYLQEVETQDRVGLAVYNSPSAAGLLESQLTNDFAYVENISRQRQAGHYEPYTNIGAGLKEGREELVERGRAGALKMVVLMTDGLPNRPSNESAARTYLLQQAELTAAAGIPVVTISLGAGADPGVMAEVAEITGGAHFNVPGGQSPAQYEEDLKEVFREIADKRPLKLVK